MCVWKLKVLDFLKFLLFWKRKTFATFKFSNFVKFYNSEKYFSKVRKTKTSPPQKSKTFTFAT